MEFINDIHDEDDDCAKVMGLLFNSDDENNETTASGSRVGRAPNIERNREEGALRLYHDYFSSSPTYPEHIFARRFRMSKHLFDIVCKRLGEKLPFFQQRRDATGRPGLTNVQKCTAAMRMLAYGTAADSIDEYGRMGASTALECLKKFCKGVVTFFKDEYLSPPNQRQTEILLQRGENLGFPGMLGSIDCSKWKWKNCPTAHHGQMKGKEKVPTITMEAIADDRLYIWHAFFGVAGCNNDITVFEASPIIGYIANATYPLPCEYTINNIRRNKPYWLCDGIYAKAPFFVHSIVNPSGEKECYYAERQEGRRKDIERAFGVLQSKFHIIVVPSRLWSKADMKTIIYACVILHNMVVNEKRPLVPLESRHRVQGGGRIVVSDEVECCFVREQGAPSPTPGTVAALCATHHYAGSFHEYMTTRRLVYNKVVSELNRS